MRWWLIGWALCGGVALGASPQLGKITPRGGQRGTEVEITFLGAHLGEPREVLLYQPGITVDDIKAVNANQVKARIKIAREASLGEYSMRLVCAGGISDLRTFFVGPYPVVESKAPNGQFEKAQKIGLNVTVAGVILAEQENYFSVEAHQGQRLSVEVEGMRLGTALFDPAVAILDMKKFELADVDDTALLKQDCFASIIVPHDGIYVIRIRDSAFGGSPECHYRMHVGTFPRPHVVFPLGGHPGATMALEFIGDASGVIKQTIEVPQKLGDIGLFADSGGQSPPSPNYFRVSPLADVMQAEPNHDLKTATPARVELPLAFNGIISVPGRSDYYSFRAHKGEPVEINVIARRLRSPLDSELTVYDAAGRHLGFNDDFGGPDSYLRFVPPADGSYALSVRDHMGLGGPDFVYRVELTLPEPAVSLTIAAPGQQQQQLATQERQAVNVPRGNRYATMVRVSRQNFGGDLALEAAGLPRGLTMEPVVAAPGVDAVPVIFDAAADAPVDGRLCDLTGHGADARKPVSVKFAQEIELVANEQNKGAYHTVRVEKMAAAVTDEAPIKIRIVDAKVPLVQSGSMNLHVAIERQAKFDKPVTLRVLYQPPGVTSAVSVEVPGDRSEGIYPLNAAAAATAGKQKILVLASTDADGPVWVASQLAEIEVVAPYLAVRIPNSAIEQGRSEELVCKVEHKTAFEGTAKVELLGLPVNVSAEARTITAADGKVVFNVVTNDKSATGPCRSVFCRVTMTRDGEEIVQDVGQGSVLRINSPPPGGAGAVARETGKP